MSIETLTAAAKAAGFAMAASEELLVTAPAVMTPEAADRRQTVEHAVQPQREPESRRAAPRELPALADWWTFWRVTA
jgi:hypothetical protein